MGALQNLGAPYSESHQSHYYYASQNVKSPELAGPGLAK